MNILWLIRHNIETKDGKYTSNTASVRYRCLIPAFQLLHQGHQVRVFAVEGCDNDVFKKTINKIDVIIVSKVDYVKAEYLISIAKQSGKKIIIDFCDVHFDKNEFMEPLNRITKNIDLIVTSTPKMKEITSQYFSNPIVEISDPYEGTRKSPIFSPKRALQLLWFGHITNIETINPLVLSLPNANFQQPVELKIISSELANIRESCASYNTLHDGKVKLKFSLWSVNTVWRALCSTDIVVIPSNDEKNNSVKSPNRLFESLWAGKMVVAHPIPTYSKFKDYAIIGSDIVEGISQCLSHSENEITDRISAGQVYIKKHHSPSVIAKQWETALKSL